MSDKANPFWAFSLNVWENETVRTFLLEQQNRHAVDLNLVLYALWQTAQNKIITHSEHLQALHKDWQVEVISPIRSQRVHASQHPSLKQALLKAELEAERLYQSNLFELDVQKTDSKMDQAATLKANLRTCAELDWEESHIRLLLGALPVERTE